MKKAIAAMVLLFLFFGCVLPSSPAQQAPSSPQQPSGPQSPASCSDGTRPNSCSPSKPLYCSSAGALESNPQLCGCPAGSMLQGDSCVSECDDGTGFNSCSFTRPLYCNQYGQLAEKSSQCGCPSGKVRSGEGCTPACPDGTLPGQCSASKPSYCSESLSLVSNPGECGCPSGQVFKDGACKAAKCIDGTPVGGCSVNMLPTYCDDTLTLVRNPRVCGCLSDEILSEDSSQCLNPGDLIYGEEDSFKVFGDAYMRVRDAELIECATGDYIRLLLSVDNTEGDSAYSLFPQDVSVLAVTGPAYYEHDWIPVQYPSGDGLCREPESERFAWTYTMPGDINVGYVWYQLPDGFDSGADYYFYYREIRVELDL